MNLLTHTTVVPGTGPQTVTRLPDTLNLAVYAGDDVSVDLVIQDADGADADLSEARVRAQIRVRPQWPSVAGVFSSGISGNIISLLLPGSVTARLPSRCVWDCELTDATDQVTTLVAGAITVTPDVTR